MSKLVVTGGQQRNRTLGVKEWSQYEKGVILIVDSDSGQIVSKHSYVSPSEYRADQVNVSVLFKSASVVDDRLYVCTQTEVLVYQLPDFILETHISIPCFNDVHHVAPSHRGTLLVVSTGLDLVVEVSMNGEVLQEWFTVDSSNWQRFSRDTDYRKQLSTKPHHSHPNYVFEYNKEIWVTRFEQKDAICLTGKGRIDIGIERVHDGFVKSNLVYFTTIDGHIIEADLQNEKVLRSISLRPYFDSKQLLGWCRGLYPVDSENFIVGFSRIRASAIHRNLLWARKWLEQSDTAESAPTRISKIDTKNQEIVWEYDLEAHGLNAIFSIHLLDD